jgi:aryl-alcohol dehydrogenase-like predicted oxidoreductase
MGWLRDRITPQAIDKVKSLTAIANGLGATTAQLAIAWLLRRKEVSSVITGATRVDQLDENLAAAEIAEKLDDHTLEAIDYLFPQDHH